MNKEHWQDWVQAALGLWLVVSPWVLGPDGSAVTWNFLLVGLALIALAGSEISVFQRWKLWLMAALGAWLVVSPRIVEFMETQALAWNGLICGLAIVALAAWALGDAHEILPRLVRPKDDLRDDLQGISVPDETEHMAGARPHRPDTGPDIVHPGGGTQTPGQTSHE